MEDKDKRVGAAAEMRRQAEALYLKQAPALPEDAAALPPGELKSVLHELRVHQIELEMQNEELRRAQNELEAQRTRYFDLYDLAPVGYLTVSGPGLILDANLAAVALLGAARSMLVHLPFNKFITKDDQDRYYSIRKTLLATGERQECELRLVKMDGAAFWGRLDATQYKNDAGAVALRLTLSDITARKQAEQKNKYLIAEMKEKEQEMVSFLYAATHDLRTPLVNVQGYSGQLCKQLEELREILAQAAVPEELKSKAAELLHKSLPEAMGYITGGALKMGQLITALLKVARIGRLELAPEPLNMDVLLKKVADTFAFELDKAGGTITIVPLPQCTADAAAINQVFSNIISNAVKYRDPARKLRITVTGALKDACTALYVVTNNGLSISAADLPRIWDFFYSGSEHGHLPKGEGIGLTIVKRIVSMSSGHISAESKEGGPTVFRIELPVGGRG